MTEQAPEATGQAAEAAPEATGQASEATEVSWYNEAPDELKGYIQNKGWDDPLKAVQGYQNLEKFQGVPPEQLLKLPKEGEPMDEIYDKLGRPPAADAYQWTPPEGMPVDDGFLNTIKTAAYEKGASQEVFESMANAYAEYQAKAIEAHQEELAQKQTAELTKLQNEWGNAFDERAELGRRFVRSNLPDNVDKEATLNAIEEAIGTATMLKMFANSGDKFKEDKLPTGEGDRPFGYSREQAISEKKELMQTIQADPERLNNYNRGIGPDLDKMKRLNKIVAG